MTQKVKNVLNINFRFMLLYTKLPRKRQLSGLVAIVVRRRLRRECVFMKNIFQDPFLLFSVHRSFSMPVFDTGSEDFKGLTRYPLFTSTSIFLSGVCFYCVCHWTSYLFYIPPQHFRQITENTPGHTSSSSLIHHA